MCTIYTYDYYVEFILSYENLCESCSYSNPNQPEICFLEEGY